MVLAHASSVESLCVLNCSINLSAPSNESDTSSLANSLFNS
jgi:hypothetical protein